MIIGLTGQSGAGKSTVASLFSEIGFHIIDCDALVHALYGEARYVKAIADVFGEDFVKDGAVDRKKLGALVFSDQNALARLNQTVHPLILDAVLSEIARARQSGVDAILDAPLLFEYALETMCDTTLGVVCDKTTAETRLSQRDGKSLEEIRGRRSAQHDEGFFHEHCAHILENNGDYSQLKENFDLILKEMLEK